VWCGVCCTRFAAQHTPNPVSRHSRNETMAALLLLICSRLLGLHSIAHTVAHAYHTRVHPLSTQPRTHASTHTHSRAGTQSCTTPQTKPNNTNTTCIAHTIPVLYLHPIGRRVEYLGSCVVAGWSFRRFCFTSKRVCRVFCSGLVV